MVGTAEIIRLAITAQIKPVTYLSTVAVAMSVAARRLRRGRRHPRRQPGAPRRQLVCERLREQQVGRRGAPAGGARPLRPAGRGVPLRHDPRPHPICRTAQRAGCVHPAASERSGNGHRAAVVLRDETPTGRPQRAHYDGLPVDFVAESIITLAAKPTDGYRSFDVMNPYDDGVSLDTFVDWLINAGHRSHASSNTRSGSPIRNRVDRASRAPAPTQRAASARRVPQAGEADTGRHRTGRGVSTALFARRRLAPTKTFPMSRSR